MWILSNLKTILAVIAALILAYFLHTVSLNAVKRQNEADLKAQRELLVATCQKSQQVTQEASNALQSKLKDINARHADAISKLLKHEAGKCVYSADPSGGYDAGTGSDGLYNATRIIDLGAAAERQTQQLISCQAFVRAERK